jgi:hypothetical protein
MQTSLINAELIALHPSAVTKSLIQARNVTERTGVLQFALETLLTIFTRDPMPGSLETCNLPFVSLKLAPLADL